MIDIIQQFGILFLIIVIISFFTKMLKQPIIMAYVGSGLAFSFFLTRYKFTGDYIAIMSELGITFLLFLMGLEFDLKNLKYMGKDILISTTLQSLAFFFIAFSLSSFFHFTMIERVYLSILFMFSSTLLVAKLLEEKKETNTLQGKVIISTLIIQDIFAILAITVLSVVNEKSVTKILLAPLGGIVLIAIAAIMSKFILNKLFRIASSSPELVFIFSLGVCFFFVELAPLLGYSTTIGAFIAGVALGNTIYKTDAHVKLRPLTSFFNMLFFVGLGFQMDVKMGIDYFWFLAILFGLSLFAKPIIIYFTLRARAFDTRTSLLSGIYLAQLSEFGIIIIAAGVFNGIISQTMSALAVLCVITTMVISSYFIKHDRIVYKMFERMTRWMDVFFVTKDFPVETVKLDYNVIFFGYYDLSKDIFAKLDGLNKRIVVIENDPENIELLKKDNIKYIYASISDPDFFEHIKFDRAEIVVSSHTNIEDNKMIIKEIKKLNPKAVVIVSAKNTHDSLELYDHGADYVIYSSYLNEQRVSLLIEDYTTDIHRMITKKINDIEKLKEIDEKRHMTHETNNFLDIDHFIDTIEGMYKGKKRENYNFSAKKL